LRKVILANLTFSALDVPTGKRRVEGSSTKTTSQRQRDCTARKGAKAKDTGRGTERGSGIRPGPTGKLTEIGKRGSGTAYVLPLRRLYIGAIVAEVLYLPLYTVAFDTFAPVAEEAQPSRVTERVYESTKCGECLRRGTVPTPAKGRTIVRRGIGRAGALLEPLVTLVTGPCTVILPI